MKYLPFSLAFLLVPSVQAQRFLVTESGPPIVRLFDTSTGALVENVIYDLSIIPAPESPQDAGRVGNQVWVSGTEAIYRFDAYTQQYLGEIDTGNMFHRGMDVGPQYVWVTASNTLIQLDLEGNIIEQFAIDFPRDVFERDGILYVTNGIDERVDVYELLSGNLNIIDIINTGASGSDPEPRAVAPLADGGFIAVTAPLTEVYDADGNYVEAYQAGLFESAVQEMSDGRLFVANGFGASIYDRSPSNTGGEIQLQPFAGQVRNISPFDSGSGAYERFCPRTPNSSGPGAILSAVGRPEVSAAPNDLQLSVVGLPPMQPGLFVYSSETTIVPFGGGALCIPLGTSAFRFPTFDVSSVDGQVLRDLDLDMLPPAGSITAGSRWNFQFLHRDAMASNFTFNTSDAVAITFRP